MSEIIVHDFHEDSKEAEVVEFEIIDDIICKKYPSAHKHTPNNGDYDIFIDEINDGIEVKYDKVNSKTANICIEISQDGQDSGILITKAKYWIQTNRKIIYLAETERIKKMYFWFIKTENKMIDEIINTSLIGVELEKFTNELKMELNKYGIRILKNYPKEQSGGYTKLMDLMLIPEIIFKKICLEVADYNKLTYKDLK